MLRALPLTHNALCIVRHAAVRPLYSRLFTNTASCPRSDWAHSMLKQSSKSRPSKPKALVKNITDFIDTKKNASWVQRSKYPKVNLYCYWLLPVDLTQKLRKFSRSISARRKSKNLGISNKLHNQIVLKFVEEALQENIPRITAKELLSSLEKNDDHSKINCILTCQIELKHIYNSQPPLIKHWSQPFWNMPKPTSQKKSWKNSIRFDLSVIFVFPVNGFLMLDKWRGTVEKKKKEINEPT